MFKKLEYVLSLLKYIRKYFSAVRAKGVRIHGLFLAFFLLCTRAFTYELLHARSVTSFAHGLCTRA